MFVSRLQGAAEAVLLLSARDEIPRFHWNTLQGVFYTNFPFQPEEYADSVANNEPWAKTVWWEQEGRKLYNDAMWAREFSLTWDFSA